MRLVYFSDLHDREYTWKKLDVRGDSAYALQQITNYAMDTTDVAAVVSGGDLLHSAINRSAVPVGTGVKLTIGRERQSNFWRCTR